MADILCLGSTKDKFWVYMIDTLFVGLRWMQTQARGIQLYKGRQKFQFCPGLMYPKSRLTRAGPAYNFGVFNALFVGSNSTEFEPSKSEFEVATCTPVFRSDGAGKYARAVPPILDVFLCGRNLGLDFLAVGPCMTMEVAKTWMHFSIVIRGLIFTKVT